ILTNEIFAYWRFVLFGVFLYRDCTTREGSHGTTSFQQRATAFKSVQQISSIMDRQIKHNLTGQPGYDWGMTDKPFLTIGEVADILQVSSRTVYNLIYNGTLRACRLTYHITIITKEDFFLMIRETTILRKIYCPLYTQIMDELLIMTDYKQCSFVVF